MAGACRRRASELQMAHCYVRWGGGHVLLLNNLSRSNYLIYFNILDSSEIIDDDYTCTVRLCLFCRRYVRENLDCRDQQPIEVISIPHTHV
jgi:hypothetical protein